VEARDNTEKENRMPGAMFLLDKYREYAASQRVNDPASYIEFLKTQPRFRNCALDDLPQHGIILHDARPEEHLVKLNYSVTDYRYIETGTTDPNIMYLVHGKDGDPDFLLNRGLPGTGGIATQAAELAAMGVENLVHIGTCGLVGDEVNTGHIVVAQGSYKDGGAIMLSDPSGDEIDPLAYPDRKLTATIKESLIANQTPIHSGVGFTTPIFYFQPVQLIIDLITGEHFPSGPKVGYFEMEEASFFQVCQLMGKRAASLVVGSDRYFLEDGKLSHKFEDDFDQDTTKLQMIRAALAAFKAIEKG
jgi:purine-nucleoside phosphorylase